jgi:hypothetical protein
MPLASAVLQKGYLSSPWVFSLSMMMVYTLLLLPILAREHFDPSVFIVAGDRFADTSALVTPILVHPHSTGFDGQFYYRLALAPLDFRQPDLGIAVDSPAYRMQRILYPVIAWLLAFGQKPLVAITMVLANLLGIAGIAAMAVRLAKRLSLPIVAPLALMLWPGFIITVTHDTTEILSALFILVALEAFLAGNLPLFALVGAAIPLTRETGIVALVGLCLFSLVKVMRSGVHPRAWGRVAASIATFLPFLLWQGVLLQIFGQSAVASGTGGNMGWPFLGAAHAFYDTLLGTRFYVHSRLWQLGMRGFVLFSASVLLWLCVMVAWRLPAALRDPFWQPLAAAWIPLAVLMTLLTGPWIDPESYFRAFTECFVIGVLLLAWRPMSLTLNRMFFCTGALSFGLAWGMCFMGLR